MPEREPDTPTEESPNLDWASATVSADRRLEVGLTTKPDKRWRERFQAIADRLGREGRSQPWQKLSLKSKGKATRIVIERLELDGDDYVGHVRQHLDAVIAQANAATAPEPPPEADQAGELDADPRDRAARAATEAFRRLAEE